MNAMPSLFEEATYKQTIERIQQLQPSSQAQWGTMNVAQMLAHLNEAFTVPLQTKKHKNMLLGYIFGPFLKKKLVDASPIKKNIPTAPSFKMVAEKDFEKEKNALLESLQQFNTKQAAGIGNVVHPFFRTLTGEEWGIGMQKHINHHLEQFGV